MYILYTKPKPITLPSSKNNNDICSPKPQPLHHPQKSPPNLWMRSVVQEAPQGSHDLCNELHTTGWQLARPRQRQVTMGSHENFRRSTKHMMGLSKFGAMDLITVSLWCVGHSDTLYIYTVFLHRHPEDTHTQIHYDIGWPMVWGSLCNTNHQNRMKTG